MQAVLGSDSTPMASRLRLPALWLLAAPLAFVSVIVTAILGFSGVGVFENITAQQMASIRIPWVLFNTFAGLAVFCGAVGIALLGNALKGASARVLGWIVMASAAVGAALALLFIVLRATSVGFTEVTLGLNNTYQLSDSIFKFSGVTTLGATFLASISLFTTRLLRRAGLVVALLTAVLFILNIALGGFPPFIFAFLWLVLGIGLLRRKA